MAYREAAQKMANDPETVAKLHDQLGNYTTVVKGIDDAMEQATNVPPEAEKWVLGWLKDRFGYEPN
jgi:hypothetical protein